MSCNVTSEDYARVLKQLLPPGPAMQFDGAETIEQILMALADSYNAVHDRSCDLLREMIPSSTVEMLPDWERVAGLPDDCDPGDATTLEARRKALLARLGAVGGQSKDYFIALAALFGFTISIYEYNRFTAGHSTCGEALTNDDWHFTWRVKAESLITGRFRAGLGRAGEPLQVFGNEILECILNKWKPAHTYIIFDYSEISYE